MTSGVSLTAATWLERLTRVGPKGYVAE
ncbi:MAG: hypothetical protein QOG34_2006, partial [Frankiaceae bacterium]|nr:hypothetical protein [Frankiaceae bacterium]